MRNYLLFITLTNILLFGGCKGSEKSQDSVNSNIANENPKNLKAMAFEKLGEGVKMESRSNWVLCTKNVDQRQLVFFIYDKHKETIAYEEMNPVRAVVWSADDTITIKPYSRTPSEKNNDYSIDLRTQERTNTKKSY